jgi:hypothetical protein
VDYTIAAQQRWNNPARRQQIAAACADPAEIAQDAPIASLESAETKKGKSPINLRPLSCT